MIRTLLSVVVIGLMLSGPAAATPVSDSQAWFSALSETDRADIQRSLILTGDYAALVDGEFGPGTFRAITAYQKAKGYPPTGLLLPDQNAALQRDAGAIFQAMGFDLVRDKKAGLALAVPLTVLSVRSEGESGTSYSSPDGGIVVTAQNVPANRETFSELYKLLSSASPGTTLTYSAVNDVFFVVSGIASERRFYTLFQHTATESVGYTVSWTEQYQAQGNLIAVLAASYSSPLSSLAPEPPPVKTATIDPADSSHFGSFAILRSVPTVLLLDGDIKKGAEADFSAALASDSAITTIVLNSDGGQVSEAIAIAEDVKRFGLDTLILKDFGCYSACAYIYFAGKNREDDGSLGVHQIYGDGIDASDAQSVLSVVLDALNAYGVSEGVISVMLATPPSDIHVFNSDEIASLGINRGDRLLNADGPPRHSGGAAETHTRDTPLTASDLGL